MLDVEDQLRKYGEAVEGIALAAAEDRPPTNDEPEPLGDSGRGRTSLLVALAASVAVVVGGAVVAGQWQGRGASLDATSEAASQVVEEWEGYAVPAYITDATPDGMTVSATMSAADYDTPLWTISSQTYWVDGKTVPDETDQRLAISWFADDGSDSSLYGEPITVRGTEGATTDDVVRFVDDGFHVVLSSTTFSTDDLIALAEELTITEDGVQPLEDVPGGLTALPVRRLSTYEANAATVPLDGHTVTYTGGERELNIVTSPRDGGERAFQWRDDVRQVDVDGRQVWMQADADHPAAYVNAVWVEGDVQIAILAFGLDEDEVLAVIAGTRPASKTEW